MNRIVIGLIGGIGSGKSTVAKILKEYGARVINADKIGHELLKKPEIQQMCADIWGIGLSKNGRINRAKLASIVFKDMGSLNKLQRVLHPRIKSRIELEVRKAKGLFVIDAPLLVESNISRLCDILIFVKTAHKSRIARVRKSRGWDSKEIFRRERFQLPVRNKVKKADFLIDNSGTLDKTRKQVKQLVNDVFKVLN